MEKQPFEEIIRQHLNGHESAPDQGIWNKIQADLDASEKSRILFKRNWYGAVAASVLMITATVYLWPAKDEINQEVTNNRNTVLMDKSGKSGGRPYKVDASQNLVPLPKTVAESTYSEPKYLKRVYPKTDSVEVITTRAVTKYDSNILDDILSPDNNTLLRLSLKNHITAPAVSGLGRLGSEPLTRDLGLAYRMADVHPTIPNVKRKYRKNSSWFALGLASGNYQQKIMVGDPDAGSSKTTSVYFGRNSGRIAVFGGLALSSQSYNRVSNLATGRSSGLSAVSSENISVSAAQSDLQATSTYTVSTEKRYLSIPIQAGWYVIDRKIKGMISLGIVSDYFLNSKISDVSGTLQTTVIRRGSETATYAGWVFSGFAGSEWSYAISENYHIAISPGLRFSGTPVYRKDLPTNGRSYTFDIGIRFRYFLVR